jgi:Asp/Glu/hydantoin racemase
LRIKYVNPVGSGDLDAHFEEQLAGCAGDDVEVVAGHLELPHAPDDPFLPRQPFYQGILFEALKGAEDEGFDGAVIGCSGDPGLLEARRFLRMPVSAPLEAALHLSASLHQRVAILVADGFEAHVLYRDLARYYGLGHVIGEILTVPMEYPDLALPALVLARHEAVLAGPALELARGALERGAGVVYAGCTLWTGEMLGPFRRELGVPVIDPGQAAVLMAAAAARARRGAGRATEAQAGNGRAARGGLA